MQSLGLIGFRKFGGVLSALTTQTCLVKEFDNPVRVDLHRNLKSGQTIVTPSLSQSFSSFHSKQEQTLSGIRLEHSDACPALSTTLQNISQPMKLCCCVLLRHGNSFLATKRTKNLTFPGAWVLPGGRVESGETVMEAGLRECEEEVGRKYHKGEEKEVKETEVMLWESHFVKEGKVCRGNLVLFITINTEIFDVKVQQSQVADYKWMDIANAAKSKLYDSVAQDGFAMGHLKYLNIITEKLPVPSFSY